MHGFAVAKSDSPATDKRVFQYCSETEYCGVGAAQALVVADRLALVVVSPVGSRQGSFRRLELSVGRKAYCVLRENIFGGKALRFVKSEAEKLNRNQKQPQNAQSAFVFFLLDFFEEAFHLLRIKLCEKFTKLEI